MRAAAVSDFAGGKRVGVRMVRRVSSLNTLGEVDVLSAGECEEVADVILGDLDRWTQRSPSGLFFTLGINAYMDLAPSADANASYFGPARSANLMLKQGFAGLHGRLAAVLEREIGLPTRYADDLAMPGFHIWVGSGIPQRPSASIHFDLQYQRLLTRPQYARASGTVSFTLPIKLPAAGSSLRVWPCIYPDDVDRLPAVRQTDPEIVPYHVGSAIVHSGHVLHQIGTTSSVRSDEFRITMQGHGLVVDEELVLYW
ncbi:hypothetical protein J5X84_25690 [Streptosporangiaceae bacterium NEAU-GS5]|nr:hypothetical protein [Streptosporangiaceae bacterium NEAU-GS5]